MLVWFGNYLYWITYSSSTASDQHKLNLFPATTRNYTFGASMYLTTLFPSTGGMRVYWYFSLHATISCWIIDARFLIEFHAHSWWFIICVAYSLMMKWTNFCPWHHQVSSFYGPKRVNGTLMMDHYTTCLSASILSALGYPVFNMQSMNFIKSW
jgi:hypothetical protein